METQRENHSPYICKKVAQTPHSYKSIKIPKSLEQVVQILEEVIFDTNINYSKYITDISGKHNSGIPIKLIELVKMALQEWWDCQSTKQRLSLCKSRPKDNMKRAFRAVISNEEVLEFKGVESFIKIWEY